MDDLTRFRERLFAALRDGPPLTVAIAADTAVKIFGPEVRRLRRELGRERTRRRQARTDATADRQRAERAKAKVQRLTEERDAARLISEAERGALQVAIEQARMLLDRAIAASWGGTPAGDAIREARAALDHPTDQTGDTNRGVLGRILTVRQDVDRRLHRALFGDPPRTGVRVINDQMADDYDPPSTSVNPRPADPTACQGCADSLAKCRADGGRCCDLCQHPTDTTGETTDGR